MQSESKARTSKWKSELLQLRRPRSCLLHLFSTMEDRPYLLRSRPTQQFLLSNPCFPNRSLRFPGLCFQGRKVHDLCGFSGDPGANGHDGRRGRAARRHPGGNRNPRGRGDHGEPPSNPLAGSTARRSYCRSPAGLAPHHHRGEQLQRASSRATCAAKRASRPTDISGSTMESRSCRTISWRR